MLCLLGGVILLYGYMLPLKPASAADSAPLNTLELEQTMEAFAAEIEEENKELMNVIADMKRVHASEVSKLEHKLNKLELSEGELLQLKRQIEAIRESMIPGAYTQSTQSSVEPPLHVQDMDKPSPEVKEEPEDTWRKPSMKDRYRELFELYESGKSIEAIARKLHMNKGEVQLIIGLARREEASDA